LINIRVPKSARNKGAVDRHGSGNNEQNIEIWKGENSNKSALTNTSYNGSDIADEFEYNFDPTYTQASQRFFSP
jgi:hypothetical protein